MTAEKTLAEFMELTGRATHMVRGFLAGLNRKDISVEVAQKGRELISPPTRAALAPPRPVESAGRRR